MRRLARQLLSLETASQNVPALHSHAGMRVCDKLQTSVIQFAGSDGFAALLRRALALTRAESPTLQAVNLKSDGTLDAWDALDTGEPDGAIALITHLLGLLETFIGEPLTLRLVRRAWPDASLDVQDSTS
jgi:hypothetical protein